MGRTQRYFINGKLYELPIYKAGDRVQLLEAPTIKGTVKEIKNDGLYVHVIWDKFQHPSIKGIGVNWLVSNIQAAK